MHNERQPSEPPPGTLPACSHRPPCPGCPHFGHPGLAPFIEQRVRAFCEQFGVRDVQILSGVGPGYRHRARLAVRGRAASPKLGLFELASHRVVDIPRCVIHHPIINRAAVWLKSQLRDHRIAPYSDAHHAGLLRYVQLTVERHSGQVQLVLVVNSDSAAPLFPLFEAWQRQPPEFLHSVVFNGHTARGNSILGPHWEHLWGQEMMHDEVGGAQLFYPPGAFSQANPWLFDELVSHLHRWVEPGSSLIELYCGVGAIGLGLLPVVADAVFNEIADPSLRGLQMGLNARSMSDRTKARIVPGDAQHALDSIHRDACVIVDPPRKGLEASILAGVCERRPRRLIYLSCGFDALVRDAQALQHAGYSVQALRAAALFPFTEHVETLVRFEQGSGASD